MSKNTIKFSEGSIAEHMLPATANKYQVKGLDGRSPILYFPDYGKVNFKTLTVAGADALVKKGFKHLEVKQREVKSKSSTTK